MAWRTAHAIDALRAEINLRWPQRSKVSDGTIGDAAHASRNSDHNPWVKVNGVGVVRAIDITAEGIDPAAYAEHLRALGKAGDPRLVPGGYVIWNKRIASERQGWAWRPYTGANGHTRHIHLSLSTKPSGFDSRSSWGISGVARPKPAPPGTDPNKGRVWRQFSKNATDDSIYNKRLKPGQRWQVSELQMLLAHLGFYRDEPDGVYGPVTLSAVIAFKDAASWRDRSSIIDADVIGALRALAAAKK